MNLIDCERTSLVPWLSRKFIHLKNTELLFLPLPKQQLPRAAPRDFSAQGLLSTASWASSAWGRTLLLLGSTSCTSLGWSNRKSMFPGQHLAVQGGVDCPELLVAGARLSLASVSHSALGDRRQGTLLPMLIRQYHSRKSVSFLKVSGFFCGPVCPLAF